MKIEFRNDAGHLMGRSAMAHSLGYKFGLLYAWGECEKLPVLDHAEASLREAFDSARDRAIREENQPCMQ